MSETSIKDRAAGAVMGTLIGDALGVGPHWYYDLNELKSDYGDWIHDYTAPKPGRHHAGLKAGENSQTGQVVTFLLESVTAKYEYVQSDFTHRLDALPATLDGTPTGGRYTDAAMRHVWRARQAGLDWLEAGSYADTAEAAIRTPVLAARYHDDLGRMLQHAAANVLLTHRDPFVAGQSAVYYFAARFEDDFEMAVLSAINGGGNNMGRASLTGALAGAQTGLSGIPQRLIDGLWDHERLLDMVHRLVGFPAGDTAAREDVCIKAPEWAEHARMQDDDQPCDDGRSGRL